MDFVSTRQGPVVDRLLKLCDETGAVMAAVQDNSQDEQIRIPQRVITKLNILKKEINNVLSESV